MTEDTAELVQLGTVRSENTSEASKEQAMPGERKTKMSLPFVNEIESFNPFSIRRIPWSDLISDFESVILLSKSVIGIGFLQVPYGFSKCGLIGGLLTVIFATVISIHVNYLWVKCAHEISYRNKISKANFGDVVVTVLSENSASIGRHAKLFKLLVKTLLFSMYFVVCCCFLFRGGYFLMEAFITWPNFTQRRVAIIIVSTVVILGHGFVSNLKVISHITKITLAMTIIGPSLLFFDSSIKDLPEEDIISFGTFQGFIEFCCVMNFSLHHIGLLLPLENEMEYPHHLIQDYCLCGVNSLSITIASVFYAAFGYMASVKYGSVAERYIIENLSCDYWLSQYVHFFTGLSVMGCFSFPYYNIYQILWKELRSTFINRPTLGKCLVKAFISALMILSIIFYENHIGHYLIIIGAFCWSTVGIIIPAILETITYWNKSSYIPYNLNSSQVFININDSPSNGHGLGKYRWRALKNMLLVIYGIIDVYKTFYYTVRASRFIIEKTYCKRIIRNDV